MRRIARAALSRAQTSTTSARVDATALNARGVQWRAKDWSTQDLDDDDAPEKPPAFEKPKPKRAHVGASGTRSARDERGTGEREREHGARDE